MLTKFQKFSPSNFGDIWCVIQKVNWPYLNIDLPYFAAHSKFWNYFSFHSWNLFCMEIIQSELKVNYIINVIFYFLNLFEMARLMMTQNIVSTESFEGR